MSVGVVIVGHDGIGDAVARTARAILGGEPLALRVLGVAGGSRPETLRERLRGEIAAADEGDGVLVLTDLFGATPANVAAPFADGDRVRVVSGLSLPMLLRVLNYPGLALAELAAKAVSGGREGVVDSGERDDR